MKQLLTQLLLVPIVCCIVNTCSGQAPTITSFTPSSGSVGTLVTLSGANQNSATVTIGGVTAIVVSNTATQTVAMVMPGAVTGAVAISTTGGTGNGVGNFSVTATKYPNAQQGSKLVGTGAVGKALQGSSVAISADGNTAIVAGHNDNNGQASAWIYIRVSGIWTQQGSKLAGTGSSGEHGAVSISADGNTVIIGGSGYNGGVGAAWIFTRTGTTWSQQGQLVGAGAPARQGYSVSLSADGNTAIVGCPTTGGTGGSIIYKRTGTTWSQQTILVGTSGGEQGYSVQLSGDGNTAIVGSVFDNPHGAAWIFAQAGNTWTQQSAKLMAPGFTGDNSAGGAFGRSVSLSADGNTAIVGGPNDNNFEGGGWVFVRNSGVWSQQGSKLVGTDAQNAYQGTNVSLSADGNTAMVSGWGENGFRGAAWAFTRTGTIWTQQGIKLLGAGFVRNNIAFGFSASLSADGNTAIIGAIQDDDDVNYNSYPLQGAAWIFNYIPPPTITSFSPTTGPAGTQVTITGINLDSLKSLAVGGTAMTIVSKTSTQAVGTIVLGSVSGTIALTTTGGTISSVDTFIVIPTPPPTITTFSPASGAVGTLVTINGTNFNYLSALTVGGASAIIVSATSTQIVAMVMPGAATAAVTLTTVGGTIKSTGNFTVTPTKYPAIQQGSKLVGTGNTGDASQGTAIAISADGNTAVVGGFNDNTRQGAVWIYNRVGTTWQQQGAKLIGTGSINEPQQGYSVAINADGNTVVVGGFGDNNSRGAVWVFTRTGSTWSQQGPKLVAAGINSAAYLGRSVSVSADGNTIIAGAPLDVPGSAWIFTRTGTAWSQQGPKLIGTGTVGSLVNFGFAVSISADGNTAIIGANAEAGGIGAAWIFTRTGTAWLQQGPKLVGADAVGPTVSQGASVAISADGNTAIVGGYNDNNLLGAAWIYTRNGSTWTQQGNKLVGTGLAGDPALQGTYQGWSVSLTADGNTAMVGVKGDNNNLGAVLIYKRTGSTWAQQGGKLVGAGSILTTGSLGNYINQGSSVSVSADGSTGIFGGERDNNNQGAAWIFTSANPVITTTGSMSALSNCSGLPSAAAFFKINAKDLLESLHINAPAGFEISLAATGSYSSSLTIAATNYIITDTTVYVRLTASATGNPSGNITCTSTGASKTISISGTVNAMPAIPVITPNRGLTICAGDSVVFSSSAVTGNQWYLNNVAIAGATGMAIAVKLSGVYTDSVKTAAGCAAGSASSTVSVNALPEIPSVTANKALTICAGDNIILGASALTGNQWYKNNTLIADATGQTFTATQSGTYIDSVTNAGGCKAGSAAITLTVHELPAIPVITNSRPLTFCSGDSTTLTSSAANGNKWYKNGVLISGQTNASYTVYESGTYRDTVTNGSGCKVSSTAVAVTVNSLPAIPTISGPSNICAGITAQFSSTISGGTWSSSNIAIASVSNTGGLVTAKTAGTTVIGYAITNSGNCSSVSTTTLTVNAAPSVAKPVITGFLSDTLVCFTESLTLVSKNVYDKYLWSTGETTASITVKNSTFISLKAGSSSVTGCYSVDSSVVINARKNVTPVPLISRVNNKLVSTSSISYQWYQNNNILPAQRTDTLVIPAKGFYSVTTSSDNICYNSSSEYLVLIDPSVIKISFDVQVYPNPSAGAFKVQVLFLKSTSGFVNITMVDQTGAVKWNTKRFLFANNDIKIPASISNLAKGTYTLRVEVNGEVNTKQVVIQ